MPNLSRLQTAAVVCIGGLVFVLGVALDILSHFQALDYLQLHWIPAYQFLNSDKTHLVLILVGFGMLGFAIVKLMQNQPSSGKPVEIAPVPEPERPMTQTQNASSGVSQSGNVAQQNNPTFNVYGGPPPPPSPEPKPRRVIPPEPKPNLILVNERMAKVNVKTDGRHVPTMLHFHEISGSTGGAALVTFRNQPKAGVTVAEAENIKVHIVFRTRGGNEIGTGISAAPWMGEYHNTVDISQGESKTVLIGMCGDGKLLAFDNRRSIFGSNWGNDIPDDGIGELAGEASPVIAEVQLLNYGGDVLASHKFEIDTEKIAIKRLL
jgi:hypothetical protein